MSEKTDADFVDLLDDPDRRAKLHADPAALAQYGVALPVGVRDARVVENTEAVAYFVFPSDPNAALPDDDPAGLSGE